VHVQVAVEGHLDHAGLVGPGLGDADVLVALEVHRAVRPDVDLVLARTAQVPAGAGDRLDRIELVDVHRVGPGLSRADVADDLAAGIDTVRGDARTACDLQAGVAERDVVAHGDPVTVHHGVAG